MICCSGYSLSLFPLSCSGSQAKTESCSVLWSRFLATLIVEQLVEVPTNVFQERIQQRTLEQISNTPVPQVVEETRKVFTVFSQERDQQRLRSRSSQLQLFHQLRSSLISPQRS